LSQYSKLPPISGANDDLQASCQSIQDVELAFDTAREEAKTMLKQLAEHTTLIESRIEERLKATQKQTTTFLSAQSQCMEQLHLQEVEQLRKQLKEITATKEVLAKRETGLVDQQARLSIELAAEVRARKQADDKLEKLQTEHAEEQQKMKDAWERERAKQSTSLEKELVIVHQLKEEVHAHH
jgi:signal transduction protein with GAF and PtsI domain